jgi:hypothetical protein
VKCLVALRSRRNGFALLVLPALLLRALIPVGFMPMVSAGGISIAICPGVTGLPAPSAMGDRGAAHAHHHGAGQDPSTPAHHAPCLFAASAGGAPAPTIMELTGSAGTAVAVDAGSASRVLLPTILRTQTSRGPPTALS